MALSGLDSWHILTGEYPPQLGGISDYTAQVAAGLAADGAGVHVWTGEWPETAAETIGVKVHRLAGLWRRAGLGKLNEELSRWPAPRRLLVQYAPHVWGRRGLNYTFCKWLQERRKLGDEVRLMVHEPFYPCRWWDKPTRWLLAAGQRRMLRAALAASAKVYVALPAWAEMLPPFDGEPGREMVWLPVCSHIPVVAEPAQVETLRHWFAPRGEFIVGSFGGRGVAVGLMTEQVMAGLLAARGDVVALLIGAGGERLAERLARRHPALALRVRVSGALPARDVSCHLAACDVLFQAYSDGISARRSSAIAGLAHGRPVVTTRGALTEPWWAASGGVKMVAAGDVEAALKAVAELLDDEPARGRLGARGRAFYDAHLAVEHTVTRLLET